MLDDLLLKTYVQHADERSVLSPAQVNELAMDLKAISDRAFRHVTLQWVSNWCKANGKTLKIFGSGWEQHSTLAPHAAGRAEPGDEVLAIYQASRINLQIIENGFIHSRSLDGVAAGGFFLTRRVPADGDDFDTLRDIHMLGRWAVEQRIGSPDQLSSAADPAIRALWQRTLAYHPWEPAFAVRVLKVWAATPHPIVAFPMLSDISFHDEAGFAALANRYLADDALRHGVAAQMRQIVLDQFSYHSRWKQYFTHITRALMAEN